MFFTSIREGIRSFGPASAVESEIAPAAEILRSLRVTDADLGFRKKQGQTAGRTALQKAAREHGHALSEEQMDRLMEYEKRESEREMARKRFAVQVTVSLLVVLFSLLMLSLRGPDSTQQKALYGLLGTVLGYWLR